ncbi:DNA alkylation repair protein [Kurthia sibirica]|uniref:DNA alkylation repair protein n=1 Tax=Kurthia sibirica TaxID=202750 RepID=A0A2U3ANL4_9BACL|nr:DNA alkylation repair protein [Kurthia sibirica]PWI26111.1 DNA alkylation repair protein [Kurthia sibirica]GEK34949.1 hypothetical protein KSI01_24820 [Kurthia sibirica]
MNFEQVMAELAILGKDRSKKIYMSNGAQEPLFGVATGAMKPMKKEIHINQSLAEQLYATGNYDAMYFAGVIADAKNMTAEDFNRWMEGAYFYMISDFVVAVTLAESPLGQEISDCWIASSDELLMSAGWSCYCWMLGNQKDEYFDMLKLKGMLDTIKDEVHEQPLRTKLAMNNFIHTVGVSFKPLHKEALAIAKEIGNINIVKSDGRATTISAVATIEKNIDNGRIGFKRKHVRC